MTCLTHSPNLWFQIGLTQPKSYETPKLIVRIEYTIHKISQGIKGSD